MNKHLSNELRPVGLEWPSRRTCLRAITLPAVCTGLGLTTAQGASPPSALREMRIHRVRELGLVIWTENQPPWETELSDGSGWPSFIAQSPDNYHPPTNVAYSSWPKERVAPEQLVTVARTAIRRAAQNFGLNLAMARVIPAKPVRHGVLEGLEGDFVGRAQNVPVDVKVFVGQQAERFPVACSIYTLNGKMAHLTEVIRRAWGHVAYLL